MIKDFKVEMEAYNGNLVSMFLEIEREHVRRETLKADAAFLYGTQVKHVNLRMKGWKGPAL